MNVINTIYDRSPIVVQNLMITASGLIKTERDNEEITKRTESSRRVRQAH